MSIGGNIAKVVAEACAVVAPKVTRQSEGVLASAVIQDVFTPSAVSRMVQTLPGSQVCGEFVNGLRQSVGRMMGHLEKASPDLAAYLKQSGFEVKALANSAEYHQLLLASPLSKEELQAARWELSNILEGGFAGDALSREVTCLRGMFGQAPPDSAVRKLSEEVIRRLETQKVDDLLVEQYAHLFRAMNRPLQGPMYCEVLKKVVFPQSPPTVAPDNVLAALKPLYEKLGDSTSRDRVLWHETRHYIDDVLGMQANKMKLSDSPGFRHALLEHDMPRAAAQRLLPHPETPTELGSEVGNYLPIPGASSWIRPDVFSEAFAEIGFCAEKGGAVQQGLMPSVCPSSMAYAEDLIRQALKKIGFS
jgi:hypothetical protein